MQLHLNRACSNILFWRLFNFINSVISTSFESPFDDLFIFFKFMMVDLSASQ